MQIIPFSSDCKYLAHLIEPIEQLVIHIRHVL
jgi:hypothetical protein